jgi:MFS transporter, NNP family, nitrate/nitrite transporter
VQTSFAVFTVFYAVRLATTWVVYVRKAGVAKVAGLADARI